MNIERMRAFLALAEIGHFGRASQKLGVAQPSLSQQIRRLEDELGAALFERGRHGASLTPAGEALLPRARRILLEAASAEEEVREAEAGGRLRLGFIGPAVGDLLSRGLRWLREHEPRVHVVLKELTTPRQIEGLIGGTLDVGLVRGPVQVDGLRVDLLRTDGLVAVLPRDHPLVGEAPLAVEELAGERFVLFPRRGAVAIYDAVMAACMDAGFVPRISAEATGWTSIVSLVAAGHGVSILADPVRAFRYEGVRYTPLASVTTRPELCVARRAGGRVPFLNRFVRALREDPVASNPRS